MKKLNPDAKAFRRALARAGLNQSQLAEQMGWAPPRVTELLKGRRGLKLSEALRMANVLDIDFKELVTMFGLPEEWAHRLLLVRGHVEESGTVVLYPESDKQNFERIQSPFPGYTGICLRVATRHFEPRYRFGEIVSFTPGGRDFQALDGREAFIQIKDGPLLFRVVQIGNRPGHYNLVGLRSDDPVIVDAPMEWASPIDWHKPA